MLGRAFLCACSACTTPFPCGGVCLPPPPSPLVFFFGVVACRDVALWCWLLAVPVLGLVVSVPPSPLVWAAPWCDFVFFFAPAWCVSACSGFPLIQWAAAPGLMLPLFGWVVLRRPGVPVLGVVWLGGYAAFCGVGGRFCGCWPFSCPPPCFSLAGGFACSSVCLPWAGAGTGWHSGCCWCVGFATSCPGPMGWVGYVHVALGGLSWWVRFWLCRLGSCARRPRESLG